MSDEAEITWPYVHKLKKPAATPGGEIAELSLREPTTADLLELGILDGASGSTMFALIVKLSGKPEPVLKAIPGYEVLVLVNQLSRFFALASQ